MMRLRSHAVEAITRAEEKERLRKLFGSGDKWVEAVNVFFKHVENRYLASLIRDGLVTTSRVQSRRHVSSVQDAPTFIVAFGQITIRFSPRFSPTPTSLGVIEVTSRANNEKVEYFVCDLTRGWLAPARETGLRGALRKYLPEKFVVLDEDLFDSILSDILDTREAVFTYDKEKVLDRLSYILDDVLDPAKKTAVATFLSQIRRHPLAKDVRILSRTLKTSLILRLAAPENKVQRLLPRPRDEQADNQSVER